VPERFERDFEKARRILVPNLNDWTQTGKVLARLAAKYDYEKIGQGRLTNDALIAMSVPVHVTSQRSRVSSNLRERCLNQDPWLRNHACSAGTVHPATQMLT
jgi:hypothetical protein